MKPLSKRAKLDIALVPQAINNSNVTGKYYNMFFHRKVMAVLLSGAMAATKTAKVEFLQAKDAAGTGSKALTGAEATITANASVTVATLTLATVTAGSAVTINGLTFTAHASTTTPANREFSVAGDDTADAAALTGLINDATYGVPGVKATANAGAITLTATEPGERSVTITNAAATITPATVQAMAYIEVDASDLDTANNYGYIAAKATTTDNTVVGVTLVRGDSRFEPEQVAGAGTVL